MNDQPLTMGSLFDGSGGFPLAASLNGVRPIWSSEIEPYPIKVTSKRFPHMKHYGNISEISGKEIEPVDIISFGSPCQDLSVAGQRKGMMHTCPQCKAEYKITAEDEQCPQCGANLEKTRSGLFVEAVRIIKEMREATNERYPTFIIWENVPGAYSSNKGEDFRTVLEEICSISDHSISIPKPKGNKWLKAGEIVGDNHSVAWRTLDAQYWGVPQRRRRIYLVADFRGQRASEILFKSACLQRNIATGKEPWERTTANTQKGIGETGKYKLTYGIGRSAWRSGVNFKCKPTITENISPTLTTSEPTAVAYEKQLYENHGQDARYKGPLKVSPTLTSTLKNANNQHFVISALIDRTPIPYSISSYDSNAMKSDNPHSGIYKADTSRTLDANGGNPACNQGGIVILEGNGSRPSHLGDGFKESDIMYTLNTVERHAVAYGIDRAAFNQGANAKYGFTVEEEKQPTLVAKGPGAIAQPHGFNPSATRDVGQYVLPECGNTLVNGSCPGHHNGVICSDYSVRRLTPLECSRLQGFPDWWTADTETEEPTAEDMQFWREVFETHRKVVTGAKKPKTDNQIRKWLREPGTDGAIYKMWGNGIALPCADAVFYGIVKAVRDSGKTA